MKLASTAMKRLQVKAIWGEKSSFVLKMLFEKRSSNVKEGC